MATDKQPKMIKPRQERAKRSRQRIFKAAVAIFAKKGPDGARVDQIAKLAQVNKQRIYAYFGSKQELYRRVLVDAYSRAAANERLLHLGPDDIPRMTATILHAFFELYEQYPEFWRLLTWENLNGGKSLTETDWEQIRSSYIQHLSNLYHAGQQQGFFAADVSFDTYLMLLFSTTFFYHSNQWTLSNLLKLQLGSSDVQHRLESEFLKVLENGIHPSRSEATLL